MIEPSSPPESPVKWVVYGPRVGLARGSVTVVAQTAFSAWQMALPFLQGAPGFAASVPVFVKQLGAIQVREQFTLKPSSRKGAEMSEWPEDLRVREFPEVSP